MYPCGLVLMMVQYCAVELVETVHDDHVEKSEMTAADVPKTTRAKRI